MIRIVQCLCEKRHCIMGFAYDPGRTAAQADFGSCDDITLDESNAAGYLRSMVEGLIARAAINPWCGICAGKTFSYEDAATKFSTMEEAAPELLELERQQAMTREFFRSEYFRSLRN